MIEASTCGIACCKLPLLSFSTCQDHATHALDKGQASTPSYSELSQLVHLTVGRALSRAGYVHNARWLPHSVDCWPHLATWSSDSACFNEVKPSTLSGLLIPSCGLPWMWCLQKFQGCRPGWSITWCPGTLACSPSNKLVFGADRNTMIGACMDWCILNDDSRAKIIEDELHSGTAGLMCSFAPVPFAWFIMVLCFSRVIDDTN